MPPLHPGTQGVSEALQTVTCRESLATLFELTDRLSPFPLHQKSIQQATPWLEGPEPHSNAPVRLRFLPAPPSTGIVFMLTSKGLIARPTLQNISNQDRCLCIQEGPFHLAHVEHLLAVLYALGIDNLRVEVEKKGLFVRLFNKTALPIFTDGSLPYLKLLSLSGLEEQRGSARLYRTIESPFSLRDEERGDFIKAKPGPGLSITYRGGYSSLGIEDRAFSFPWSPHGLLRELSEARTLVNQYTAYGYKIAKILGALTYLKYGLSVGINEHNSICVLNGRHLSQSRYGGEGDELVRHKTLDFIGTLSLLGPLKGMTFTVIKSSHRHDLNFCRAFESQLQSLSQKEVEKP